VSTITVLDTPGKAHALLKLYLLSFIWFGVQGLTAAGRVTWHDLMANEDSYGPLMVMLVPLAFFFSLATTSSTWRWIGRGAFALGALGVIVSFARGAALSAAAVLLYILFRTPNKAKTFTFIMLAAIVLLPVASTLVPMDAYKAELATSTSGEDPRSALWKLAWMVFQSSPIFGVGASNYGVVGARIAPPDMAHYLGAGIYQLGVHNTHIQILAEEGLLGVALWSAMFIGIFRWCRWLRTPQAQTAWIQQGGAGLDIGKVSLGFEGATVAYICTALFYNQLYIHWLWSLLAITYMLFHLTRPGGENLHARSRNRGGPIPPHRARRVS
jgi:O-antigen ligase